VRSELEALEQAYYSRIQYQVTHTRTNLLLVLLHTSCTGALCKGAIIAAVLNPTAKLQYVDTAARRHWHTAALVR
jgi:hypothetical protein